MCSTLASQDSISEPINILKIGYDERPPHRYTDVEGNPSGRDIEYLSNVLDTANIPYAFYSYPWKRVLMYIQSGQLDVAMSAGNTAERRTYAHFSHEVFSSSDNVLFLKDSLAAQVPELTSLSQLAEMRVKIGVTRGSSYSDEYELLLKNQNFVDRLVHLKTVDQTLQLALSDRISGFIASEELAQYELRLRCASNDFVPVYNLLENESKASYLMYSKKTVSPQLVEKIDRAMRQIGPNNHKRALTEVDCEASY